MKSLLEFVESSNNDDEKSKLKLIQGQPLRSYTEPMNKVIEAIYSLNIKKKMTSNYDLLIQKVTQLMGEKSLLKVSNQ